MKPLVVLTLLASLLLAACGGDGNDAGLATGGGETGAGGATPVAGVPLIAAADADGVAHAALPALTDLPGEGWVLISEDDFTDEGDSLGFAALIEGRPECATLQNLVSLEDVFGEDGDELLGRANAEYEQSSATALIGTSVQVEVEVDAEMVDAAAFRLAKEMFESEETANCLIAAINEQFVETAPPGVEFDIVRAQALAEAPGEGMSLAFDIIIDFAGMELPMSMQLYLWPHANASVRVLFVGDKSQVTADLVQGVVTNVDIRLQAATP